MTFYIYSFYVRLLIERNKRATWDPICPNWRKCDLEGNEAIKEVRKSFWPWRRRFQPRPIRKGVRRTRSARRTVIYLRCETKEEKKNIWRINSSGFSHRDSSSSFSQKTLLRFSLQIVHNNSYIFCVTNDVTTWHKKGRLQNLSCLREKRSLTIGCRTSGGALWFQCHIALKRTCYGIR